MRACRFLPLSLLVILLAPAWGAAQEIQWRFDYAQARAEAEKKGLPIIIDVGTVNCFWCKRLEEDTFRDPAVAKVMAEKFVCLKVDADKERTLAQSLNATVYPTVILAGPDGKILGTLQGFKDAVAFYDSLQRAVAAVTNPEWMQRDYQFAVKAVADKDFAKAVALLKTILEDGKQRPVQVNAVAQLKSLEQQAAGELVHAKQLLDKGKTNEASGMLTRLVKDYAGTQTASSAAGLLTTLAKTPEMRDQQRGTRVRELLAQAKDDFKTEQWLCCLDRCDLLTASYGDLPEASEALHLSQSIRSNPEWMQKACESMTARLGDLYLSLADAWLQKGQKQQAMLCLDKVVRNLPNTRHADVAQLRMNQLQGLPTQRAGFHDATPAKKD